MAYGFNEDFEIVDRDTGLPRSTRTLSGGESFQASLAFALAMVELAGRGGSRIDALFLDEDFELHDAHSLSDALDMLEQRAETGRLITIITHVREVADRIPDVLVGDLMVPAAPKPTGSREPARPPRLRRRLNKH